MGKGRKKRKGKASQPFTDTQDTAENSDPRDDHTKDKTSTDNTKNKTSTDKIKDKILKVKPLMIPPATFKLLIDKCLQLPPPHRKVFLSMNEYRMKDVNPFHEETSESPTHMIIFCLRLIVVNRFHPIAVMQIDKRIDQTKVLETVWRAFISDLSKLTLIVIGSISPPSETFYRILSVLTKIPNMEDYSGPITYSADPFTNIIHLYDYYHLLRETQDTLNERKEIIFMTCSLLGVIDTDSKESTDRFMELFSPFASMISTYQPVMFCKDLQLFYNENEELRFLLATAMFKKLFKADESVSKDRPSDTKTNSKQFEDGSNSFASNRQNISVIKNQGENFLGVPDSPNKCKKYPDIVTISLKLNKEPETSQSPLKSKALLEDNLITNNSSTRTSSSIEISDNQMDTIFNIIDNSIGKGNLSYDVDLTKKTPFDVFLDKVTYDGYDLFLKSSPNYISAVLEGAKQEPPKNNSHDNSHIFHDHDYFKKEVPESSSPDKKETPESSCSIKTEIAANSILIEKETSTSITLSKIRTSGLANIKPLAEKKTPVKSPLAKSPTLKQETLEAHLSANEEGSTRITVSKKESSPIAKKNSAEIKMPLSPSGKKKTNNSSDSPTSPKFSPIRSVPTAIQDTLKILSLGKKDTPTSTTPSTKEAPALDENASSVQKKSPLFPISSQAKEIASLKSPTAKKGTLAKATTSNTLNKNENSVAKDTSLAKKLLSPPSAKKKPDKGFNSPIRKIDFQLGEKSPTAVKEASESPPLAKAYTSNTPNKKGSSVVAKGKTLAKKKTPVSLPSAKKKPDKSFNSPIRKIDFQSKEESPTKFPTFQNIDSERSYLAKKEAPTSSLEKTPGATTTFLESFFPNKREFLETSLQHYIKTLENPPPSNEQSNQSTSSAKPQQSTIYNVVNEYLGEIVELFRKLAKEHIEKLKKDEETRGSKSPDDELMIAKLERTLCAKPDLISLASCTDLACILGTLTDRPLNVVRLKSSNFLEQLPKLNWICGEPMVKETPKNVGDPEIKKFTSKRNKKRKAKRLLSKQKESRSLLYTLMANSPEKHGGSCHLNKEKVPPKGENGSSAYKSNLNNQQNNLKPSISVESEIKKETVVINVPPSTLSNNGSDMHENTIPLWTRTRQRKPSNLSSLAHVNSPVLHSLERRQMLLRYFISQAGDCTIYDDFVVEETNSSNTSSVQVTSDTNVFYNAAEVGDTAQIREETSVIAERKLDNINESEHSNSLNEDIQDFSNYQEANDTSKTGECSNKYHSPKGGDTRPTETDSQASDCDSIDSLTELITSIEVNSTVTNVPCKFTIPRMCPNPSIHGLKNPSPKFSTPHSLSEFKGSGRSVESLSTVATESFFGAPKDSFRNPDCKINLGLNQGNQRIKSGANNITNEQAAILCQQPKSHPPKVSNISKNQVESNWQLLTNNSVANTHIPDASQNSLTPASQNLTEPGNEGILVEQFIQTIVADVVQHVGFEEQNHTVHTADNTDVECTVKQEDTQSINKSGKSPNARDAESEDKGQEENEMDLARSDSFNNKLSMSVISQYSEESDSEDLDNKTEEDVRIQALLVEVIEKIGSKIKSRDSEDNNTTDVAKKDKQQSNVTDLLLKNKDSNTIEVAKDVKQSQDADALFENKSWSLAGTNNNSFVRNLPKGSPSDSEVETNYNYTQELFHTMMQEKSFLLNQPSFAAPMNKPRNYDPFRAIRSQTDHTDTNSSPHLSMSHRLNDLESVSSESVSNFIPDVALHENILKIISSDGEKTDPQELDILTSESILNLEKSFCENFSHACGLLGSDNTVRRNEVDLTLCESEEKEIQPLLISNPVALNNDADSGILGSFFLQGNSFQLNQPSFPLSFDKPKNFEPFRMNDLIESIINESMSNINANVASDNNIWKMLPPDGDKDKKSFFDDFRDANSYLGSDNTVKPFSRGMRKVYSTPYVSEEGEIQPTLRNNPIELKDSAELTNSRSFLDSDPSQSHLSETNIVSNESSCEDTKNLSYLRVELKNYFNARSKSQLMACCTMPSTSTHLHFPSNEVTKPTYLPHYTRFKKASSSDSSDSEVSSIHPNDQIQSSRVNDICDQSRYFSNRRSNNLTINTEAVGRVCVNRTVVIPEPTSNKLNNDDLDCRQFDDTVSANEFDISDDQKRNGEPSDSAQDTVLCGVDKDKISTNPISNKVNDDDCRQSEETVSANEFDTSDDQINNEEHIDNSRRIGTISIPRARICINKNNISTDPILKKINDDDCRQSEETVSASEFDTSDDQMNNEGHIDNARVNKPNNLRRIGTVSIPRARICVEKNNTSTDPILNKIDDNDIDCRKSEETISASEFEISNDEIKSEDLSGMEQKSSFNKSRNVTDIDEIKTSIDDVDGRMLKSTSSSNFYHENPDQTQNEDSSDAIDYREYRQKICDYLKSRCDNVYKNKEIFDRLYSQIPEDFESLRLTNDWLCVFKGYVKLREILMANNIKHIEPSALSLEHIDFFVYLIKKGLNNASGSCQGNRYRFLDYEGAFDLLQLGHGVFMILKDDEDDNDDNDASM